MLSIPLFTLNILEERLPGVKCLLIAGTDSLERAKRPPARLSYKTPCAAKHQEPDFWSF